MFFLVFGGPGPGACSNSGFSMVFLIFPAFSSFSCSLLFQSLPAFFYHVYLLLDLCLLSVGCLGFGFFFGFLFFFGSVVSWFPGFLVSWLACRLISYYSHPSDS